MNKTHEEVAELIKLTPEQEKAWRSFVRAIKKCEKSGIRFYTVLETIMAMNGSHVSEIDNAEYTEFDRNGPHDLGYHNLPFHTNNGFSGFADDPHVVILND